MDKYWDIVEVDGYKHVHTTPSQAAIDRLGEERLTIEKNTNYDVWGRNLAKEYNYFCAREWSDWFLQNMHIPWITVTLYLLLIYFGIEWMKTRPKFKLKRYLMWWNLSLSIFSAFGVYYTLPHLLAMWYVRGLEYTVCAPAEGRMGHGKVGLWGSLFVWSKFPELVDTAFIVLRKSKLIFLHWYHHVTVLLFCWHGYSTRGSNLLHFMVMNYTVHSIMYFYYFLTARGYRPPWAKFVTFIQIAQMFIGILLCALVYYYWSQGKLCDVDPQNFMYASLMYFSYFVLFVWFALQRYVFKTHKSKKKAKKDPANSI